MRFSSKLIAQCKSIFVKCDEFESDAHLKAIFVGDLEVLKDNLPVPSPSTNKGRVDLCVSFLTQNQLDDGRPALLVFTLSIESNYSEQDVRKTDLLRLIEDIRKEAEKSLPASPSIEQQRRQSSENRDFHEVNGLYQQVDASVNIKSWFENCGDDLAERSFRISAAVFNSARYSFVLDAADILTKKLTPIDNKSSEIAQSPFSGGRSKRLERAEAHVVTRSDANSGDITILELDNPSYTYKLLEYVWEEYDNPTFRGPFVEWLSFYAGSRQVDMRNRAAAAVGALAKLNFLEIRDNILIEWVRKDDRLYRASIGKVLGVVAADPAHIKDIQDLFASWINHKDERFRWAASRAYANVGVYYTENAFKDWYQILLSTDHFVEVKLTPSMHLSLINPLHMNVVDSIISLLLSAAQEKDHGYKIFEIALNELKGWSDKENRIRHPEYAWGLPLFVVCMNICIPPKDGNQFNNPTPIMIDLITLNKQDKYRDLLADLIGRALLFEGTRLQATEAFHNWFEWVQGNTDSEKLLTVVGDIINWNKNRPEKVVERLNLFFREWAKKIPLAQQAYSLTTKFR